MKILIAKKDAAGRWQNLGTFATYADGRRLRNVPARHHGQIQAALAAQAARFFSAETAARTVEYAVCGGEYRADRF